VSRLVYDQILVKTPVGTDVHNDAAAAPRNDGTLRIFDSAGIERRGYAKGCWIQWTTNGDGHSRPARRH
jgi:hypothetical protein